MAELKTYKQKVYHVMEMHEQARNSDQTLWAYYIKEFFSHLMTKDVNGDDCVPLKNLKHLPANQNLRLARQLIQNHDGLLLPTDPKVLEMRRVKENNIRDAEWREAKGTKVDRL